MPSDDLEIVVDARVELISIVFHLAGNPEYNQPNQLAGYAQAVDQHFQEHRDHPAVAAAVRLRESNGMDYDGPMRLATHLTDTRGLDEIMDFGERPPLLFDEYRKVSTRDMRRLVAELRRFAHAADFWGFFDAQRPLYQRTVDGIRGELSDRPLDVGWFDEYFGQKSPKKHTLVPAMLNGGSNYGSLVEHRGREQAFCMLGVWESGPGGLTFFDRSHIVPIAVHEFCHSYVNPLIDEHLDEFETPAKKLFARSQETGSDSPYGMWQAMVYEMMVRACVRRYVQIHEDDRELQRDMVFNEQQGFSLVGQLAEWLESYENDRVHYPSLRSFVPRLVAFFNQTAASFEG